MNTYVEYDFIRKLFKHKYKISISEINSFYKKARDLTESQKRKLRELFCRDMQEIDDLEEEDTNKSHELLTYILCNPFQFKSGYSEVCKNVYNYVRSFPKIDDKSHYAQISSEEELKSIIGEEFNGLRYEDLRSGKSDDILKQHSFESPYSHFVECAIKCDYIFFEGDGLNAISEYEIPSYKEIINTTGIIPNADIPSDHMPVAVKFYYAI